MTLDAEFPQAAMPNHYKFVAKAGVECILSLSLSLSLCFSNHACKIFSLWFVDVSCKLVAPIVNT